MARIPYTPCLFVGSDEIFSSISRMKLATALTGWHPSDRSAKLILLPWKEVFPRGSLHAFVLKNIYPKLEQALQARVATLSNLAGASGEFCFLLAQRSTVVFY